jgi:hypothetical protein
METGTVGYVCGAPEHPARASLNGAGLTAHDGKWAFCPAGAESGHQWQPIDRGSFDELTRAATTAARAGDVAER